MVESRKYERISFVSPIRYSINVSNMYNLDTMHNIGVAVNISEGGLGMVTDYSLKEGNVLIFEDEIEINNITAKASIVKWARKVGVDRYQIGSEFV